MREKDASKKFPSSPVLAGPRSRTYGRFDIIQSGMDQLHVVHPARGA